MTSRAVVVVLVSMVVLIAAIWILYSAKPEPLAPTAKPDPDAPVQAAPQQEGSTVVSEAVPSPEPETEPAMDSNKGTEAARVRFIGTVTDAETGSPIPGAIIEAVLSAPPEESAGEPVSVTSDARGSYTLEVPKDVGSLTLKCSAEGYVLAQQTVPGGEETAPAMDFALKPSVAIAGKVIQAPAGPGVGGVEVSAQPYQGGGLADAMRTGGVTAKAVTEADGSYRLEGIAPGTYRVDIRPEEEGFILAKETPVVVTVEPRKSLESVDFTVEPGAAVTGIVRDSQGRPVAKARLNSFPTQFLKAASRVMSGGRPDNFIRGSQGEESGEYTIEGLQFDMEYRLIAGADGYAEVSAGPFTIEKGRSPLNLDVTITEGSTVSGRVRDADGRPAKGQKLTLMPDFGRLMTGEIREPKKGEAGDDGAFSIEHVSAGTYTVEFGGGPGPMPAIFGGDTEKTEVEVDGIHNVTGLDIRLPTEKPGASAEKKIAGTVVDGTGAPVPDAKVQLTAKGMIPESPSVQTDADGAFVFGSLRALEFDISAVASAGRADRESVKVGEEVRLVLAPGGRIVGTVIDDTGQAVAQCSVLLKKPDKSDFAAMFNPMLAGRRGASAQTDEGGGFLFENVAAGEHELETTVAEKGKGTAAVSVPAGGEVTVTVNLNPGVKFAGEVRGANGESLAGAMVKLVPYREGSPGGMMAGMMGGIMPGQAGTTDNSGRYEIRNVQDGTYSVSATCTGFANAPGAQVAVDGRDIDDYDVVLTKGGRARGQYLRDGQPGANLMIQLIGPSGMYMANTDSEGRYDVEGITPGRYLAQVVDPAQMASGNLAGMQPQQQVVEIAEGQDEALELAPRGNVTVNGQITGDDLGNIVSVTIRRPGGPAPEDLPPTDIEAVIDATSYYAGQTMAGPDGTFSVEGLEPGTYIVEVHNLHIDLQNPDMNALMNMDRTPQIRQELVIADEQPVELNLNLPGAP